MFTVPCSLEYSSIFDIEIHPTLMQSLAEVYCDIWSEPPWNEDFWRPDQVLNDLRSYLKKPGARGFVALAQERGLGQAKLAGFCWGYIVNQSDLRDISSSQDLDQLFTENKSIFYFSELGVAKDWRNQGIGKGLSVRLIDATRAMGCQTIILRTDVKAHAARALYERQGFQEISVRDGKHTDRTYWVLPF